MLHPRRWHKQAQSTELKRNILAVLIANATNLGLVKMAEACGVPYDVLAWTQEWYVREETLREANTVIVNHHHRLDLARVFGGTMSSSDGQRFPVRSKSLTARAMNIHFADQGLSTYTHGVTLINFALFDLVGKALTPRIRDLGKITLCRDDIPTVPSSTPGTRTQGRC